MLPASFGHFIRDISFRILPFLVEVTTDKGTYNLMSDIYVLLSLQNNSLHKMIIQKIILGKQ